MCCCRCCVYTLNIFAHVHTNLRTHTHTDTHTDMLVSQLELLACVWSSDVIGEWSVCSQCLSILFGINDEVLGVVEM